MPGSGSARLDGAGAPRRRRLEIYAFVLITAIVMPALAVGTVGAFGFAVWRYQAVAGPPGPPSR